jgi:succinate dehydrogenase/fumarate reductase-like Fe-S protein
LPLTCPLFFFLIRVANLREAWRARAVPKEILLETLEKNLNSTQKVSICHQIGRDNFVCPHERHTVTIFLYFSDAREQSITN